MEERPRLNVKDPWMPDKQEEQPRRSQERRMPPMGGNLIWYMLALGIGVLFVVSLSRRSPFEIGYMELARLIEQGSPQQNPNAAIVVEEGSESRRLRIRYSNLRNLKIGPTEITGTVARQVIDPEKDRTPEPQQKVFRTARYGMEEDGKALIALLREKGFVDVRGEEAPSPWNTYVTMLIFTIPLVVIFLFLMRRLGGAGSAV